MEYIAPLLQSLLWVGLIGFLVWRYNKPIDGILQAIQGRIESGSDIKAGPIQIGARPQAPEQQAQVLEQEVVEIEQNESAAPQLADNSTQEKKSTQAEYLLATDFAIREIQFEFDTPVNRQVQIGGVPFDGMFAQKGAGYFVEVKFVRSVFERQKAVDQIIAMTAFQKLRFGWQNIYVVLAVVFDDPKIDLSEEIAKLKRLFEERNEERFLVRCYQFRALAKKFGVDIGRE